MHGGVHTLKILSLGNGLNKVDPPPPLHVLASARRGAAQGPQLRQGHRRRPRAPPRPPRPAPASRPTPRPPRPTPRPPRPTPRPTPRTTPGLLPALPSYSPTSMMPISLPSPSYSRPVTSTRNRAPPQRRQPVGQGRRSPSRILPSARCHAMPCQEEHRPRMEQQHTAHSTANACHTYMCADSDSLSSIRSSMLFITILLCYWYYSTMLVPYHIHVHVHVAHSS